MVTAINSADIVTRNGACLQVMEGVNPDRSSRQNFANLRLPCVVVLVLELLFEKDDVYKAVQGRDSAHY